MDDTLYPVWQASICWTFMTNGPQFWTRPTIFPHFQTKLMPLVPIYVYMWRYTKDLNERTIVRCSVLSHHKWCVTSQVMPHLHCSCCVGRLNCISMNSNNSFRLLNTRRISRSCCVVSLFHLFFVVAISFLTTVRRCWFLSIYLFTTRINVYLSFFQVNREAPAQEVRGTAKAHDYELTKAVLSNPQASCGPLAEFKGPTWVCQILQSV